MFQTKVVEKSTHSMFSNFFLVLKSCRLWDNVEKYRRAGEVTDDNMAHAHYMPDTLGYKITLLLFHCNNGYTKAPQCYVIRKLRALFILLYSQII